MYFIGSIEVRPTQIPQSRCSFGMTMLVASSIKLPSRPTSARRFARIARLRSLAGISKVSAFFASIDPFLRPQAFENKFGGACNGRRIILRPHSKNREMLEESLDLLQLRKKLGARRLRGHLQFAAKLEPLNGRLKIHLREILREGLTNGRAD